MLRYWAMVKARLEQGVRERKLWWPVPMVWLLGWSWMLEGKLAWPRG